VLELGAFEYQGGQRRHTAHFKGNYPTRCSIQASAAGAWERRGGGNRETGGGWPVLLPEVKLSATGATCLRRLAEMGPVKFVG